ncbi:MAG: penicillin-binding protein 2, partial [Opitutaceae bacterium]|nr:penicillin-binding protein 2 [Opitutaceae bacterium]
MSRGFASSYRIWLVAGLVGVSFVGIGARLMQLHVFDRDRLLAYVTKARRDIIVENARRGDILDARGNILATSKSQIVLGVDPQTLRPQDEGKWPQLAELIGMPERELRRIFTTKTRSINVPAPAAGRGDAGPSLFDFSFTDDTPKSEAEQDVIADETPDETGERPIRWAKLSDQVDESTYEKIAALGI